MTLKNSTSTNAVVFVHPFDFTCALACQERLVCHLIDCICLIVQLKKIFLFH